MPSTNGRNPGQDDDEIVSAEDANPAEYDKMLQLDRLETLEEDMVELGVRTLDEVRQRIVDIHRELDDE